MILCTATALLIMFPLWGLICMTGSITNHINDIKNASQSQLPIERINNC